MTILLLMFSLTTTPAHAAPTMPASCKAEISFSATAEDREDAQFMKDKLDAASLLSKVLVLAPFAKAFDPNPVKMSWNLLSAEEWDAWTQALVQLDDGIRGILRKHANDVRGKYEIRNDRDRSRYWQCVASSFSAR